jgi:hypothetical protein
VRKNSYFSVVALDSNPTSGHTERRKPKRKGRDVIVLA